MSPGPNGASGPAAGDGAAAAEAAWRAAQDSAAELARMGIDPRAVGLDPLPEPESGPAPGPGGSRPVVRGVAAPPPAARTAPPARTAAAPDRATPAPAPSWLDSTLSRPIVAVPRPVPPEPGGYLAALERLVPPLAPGPAGGWRSVVRAATRGLVEPRAAAAVEHERQLVARVRLRMPEPRVVVFVAGKGGVGTSTTAAGVAMTLASLRGDAAALVSARSGAGSLGQRLAGQPAPPVPALTGGGGAAPPPLWVHDRLAVVDGSPWHSPTPAGSLVALLDLLRARHPLTLVDAGNDLGEPAGAALDRADQIVLVTGASQDAVAAARTALSRVHRSDPFRLATVVVAVVCLSERQHRRTARRLRAELGLQANRVVPVGFDPWLAAGDRLYPARLRPATRQAYLRIAGLAVQPGQDPQWFSQPATPPGAGR